MGYGYTAVNREGVDFIVTKFSDLKDKLLPPPLLHLQHPIVGYKHLDSLFFMQAVEMMQKKLHLTEEGLNKLREIQVLMNSGRKNTPVCPPHMSMWEGFTRYRFRYNRLNFVFVCAGYTKGMFSGLAAKEKCKLEYCTGGIFNL